jgi:hypothetical protein
MKRIISYGLVAVAVLAVVLVSTATSNQTEAAPVTIEVGLTGLEENPPVFGTGYGLARLVFDDATRRLDFAVTLFGIPEQEVTAAHIHRGAVGVNGPIVHNLSTTSFSQVSGTLTLSEADVADLRAGNFYVNVHSREHPGGFARGQIFLDPADGIRAAVRQIVSAWNAGNTSLFLSRFTDAGLLSSFQATHEEAEEFLPGFIGSTPITIRAISNVVVTGEVATAMAELAFGQTLELLAFTFVRDEGAWKIHDEVQHPVPIPAGVRVVPLETREFSFVFDRNAAAAGNIAFDIRNTGQQPHEVILARIPADLNLAAAVMLPEPPAGVEDVGFVGPFDPGARTTMVFTEPLAPGRYALLCFIPDPATGAPHAVLGMFAEFTVGPTAIRPPATGDAGLAASTNSWLGLVALAVLALSSGATLVAVRLRS